MAPSALSLWWTLWSKDQSTRAGSFRVSKLSRLLGLPMVHAPLVGCWVCFPSFHTFHPSMGLELCSPLTGKIFSGNLNSWTARVTVFHEQFEGPLHDPQNLLRQVLRQPYTSPLNSLGSQALWISDCFPISEYLHLYNKIPWGRDSSLNMKYIYVSYMPTTHSPKVIYTTFFNNFVHDPKFHLAEFSTAGVGLVLKKFKILYFAFLD